MVASPVKIPETHSNGVDIVEETNATDAVTAIKEAIKRAAPDSVVVSTDGSGDAVVDNEEPPVKTIKESDVEENGVNEIQTHGEEEEKEVKSAESEENPEETSSSVVENQEAEVNGTEAVENVDEIEPIDNTEKSEEVNDADD